MKKLADGHFFRFGQLNALSLLHACLVPRDLIEFVANVEVEIRSFAVHSINIVPDFELQTRLTEINDCESEKKFQRLSPERFYFGVTKLQLTLENKQKFIHDIIYHCLHIMYISSWIE